MATELTRLFNPLVTIRNASNNTPFVVNQCWFNVIRFSIPRIDFHCRFSQFNIRLVSGTIAGTHLHIYEWERNRFGFDLINELMIKIINYHNYQLTIGL